MKGVDTIGEKAFRNTKPKLNLESVELSKNIKTMEPTAFGANPITRLRLNEGLEAIGKQAFAGHHLSSLELPDSVSVVGDRAFFRRQEKSDTDQSELGETSQDHCGLSALTLNEGTEKIGSKAFYYNNLSQVVTPKSVTDLDDSAFEGNRGIEMIKN